MKKDYPSLSKALLCGLFGKTRHALYDGLWRDQEATIRQDIVLQLVHKIRKQLPTVGTRKLLFLLQPELQSHRISIGRDALFELLSRFSLLVRKRKTKVYTTNSRHWFNKYANLIRSLVITHPEQLWVSDITYIRLRNQWGYLSMVTDAFSRKIMGFAFRTDLLAEGCLAALKMALSNRVYKTALIHHSDRGCQYCCKEYIELLQSAHISISMTEQGDPYENALAERMNGIIKGEFELYSNTQNFEQTYERLSQSIDLYNNVRPHSSCDYLTPAQAHQVVGHLKKRWKTYRTPSLTQQSKLEKNNEKFTDLEPLSRLQPSLRSPV